PRGYRAAEYGEQGANVRKPANDHVGLSNPGAGGIVDMRREAGERFDIGKRSEQCALERAVTDHQHLEIRAGLHQQFAGSATEISAIDILSHGRRSRHRTANWPAWPSL